MRLNVNPVMARILGHETHRGTAARIERIDMNGFDVHGYILVETWKPRFRHEKPSKFASSFGVLSDTTGRYH